MPGPGPLAVCRGRCRLPRPCAVWRGRGRGRLPGPMPFAGADAGAVADAVCRGRCRWPVPVPWPMPFAGADAVCRLPVPWPVPRQTKSVAGRQGMRRWEHLYVLMRNTSIRTALRTRRAGVHQGPCRARPGLDQSSGPNAARCWELRATARLDGSAAQRAAVLAGAGRWGMRRCGGPSSPLASATTNGSG